MIQVAKFWPNNEICIRHAEGVRSNNPVLAKLWYFWTNHFTISEDPKTTSIFNWSLSKRIYKSQHG